MPLLTRLKSCTKKGQPVLVGTTSVEKSEKLSDLLKKKGVKHRVLNAKYHEKEAEIVAQAGRKGAVTIATNMAGRGTDILLGGNPEFMAKQETLKKGIAQPVRIAEGKIEGPTDDGKTTVWYYNGKEFTVPTEQWVEVFNRYKQQTDKEHDEVTQLAACISLAPSVTNPAASTISFVDAPAARAIRVPRASTFPLKMT